MKHAILSPSKSSMWLNCTPSARIGLKYQRPESEAADEGTLAHALAELLLKKILNRVTKLEFVSEYKKIQKHKLYSASMLEHCTQFATYVMEEFVAMQEKHGDALIFLETNLDLSKYIPEGFGTGDVIIISGHEMVVIDLKYGKGVFVHTEENTQMMIYALGAIDCFSMFGGEIKKVKMTIYQPRLDNIDSWEIPVKNLLQWAKETLLKKAKLAFEGKGKLVAGGHCTFCPAKAVCKEHAKYNMSLAVEEFTVDAVKPNELPDKKLVEIYLRAKEFRSWLASVEDYMLQKAIEGKTWKGLKLVHGRSVRQITNPAAVLEILKRMKLPTKQYLSEPKLLGITALENNIGAQLFAKMAGKYIEKPKGKPSLVHEENKGQDYDANNSAKDDF